MATRYFDKILFPINPSHTPDRTGIFFIAFARENAVATVLLEVFSATTISSNLSYYNKKCDILLLEGWCCGCNKISKNYLYKNINSLEKNYDKNFVWRNFYNKKLFNEYKNLFDMFDEIIFMKAPSFNYVLNWRLKQENKNTSKSKKSKKMSANEIKLFIQHYEKITKWMLINFKYMANVIIKINKHQKINLIIKN